MEIDSMAKESSQKFLARTRPPRVQIEYDVEINGAEKKVSLPFVMGVMAELSGQSVEPLPSVAEREFLEFDTDNFDERMKAIKPRVAATVPNTLTGEGHLGIDLTFGSIDDFSPEALARNIEPLRRLYEARGHLANLLRYMDGKVGAEDLVAKLLADPDLMRALAAKSDEAKPAEPKPEAQAEADSPAA
jgi:type VI secretion system protein ImpB